MLLSPGRYEVSTLSLEGVNGEPGLPIVLEGAGEGVEIVGTSPANNVISLHDNHDLELRRLDVSFIGGADPTNNSVDAIKFETGVSHDILIEDCILHDVGNVIVGAQAPEIYRVTLRRNELRNAGVCCVYWGYFEEEPKRYAHDCLIDQNLMTDCPADARSATGYGIQIKAGSYGNVIQDNVLMDVAGTSRAGIIVYHTAEAVGEPLRADNVIRRNVILRSRNEGIDAAAGAVIENNLVIDAANYGYYFQGRDGYTGPLKVINNTARLSTASGNDRGFMFSGWQGVDERSVIAHNLSLMTTADLVAFRATDGVGGAIVAENLAFGTTDIAGVALLSSPEQAVQSLSYGDPDFLFPVTGGPAVDAGSPSPAAADDFNGVTRDGLPDIGAYESTGGGNPGWTLQTAIKGEEEAGGDDGTGDGNDDGGDGCQARTQIWHGSLSSTRSSHHGHILPGLAMLGLWVRRRRASR